MSKSLRRLKKKLCCKKRKLDGICSRLSELQDIFTNVRNRWLCTKPRCSDDDERDKCERKTSPCDVEQKEYRRKLIRERRKCSPTCAPKKLLCTEGLVAALKKHCEQQRRCKRRARSRRTRGRCSSSSSRSRSRSRRSSCRRSRTKRRRKPSPESSITSEASRSSGSAKCPKPCPKPKRQSCCTYRKRSPDSRSGSRDSRSRHSSAQSGGKGFWF